MLFIRYGKEGRLTDNERHLMEISSNRFLFAQEIKILALNDWWRDLMGGW